MRVELLDPGFEPGLPRPQRGVLTTRLIQHICVWRYRVSIPVPRACKARALPIELYPHRIYIYISHISERNISVENLKTHWFSPQLVVVHIYISTRLKKCQFLRGKTRVEPKFAGEYLYILLYSHMNFQLILTTQEGELAVLVSNCTTERQVVNSIYFQRWI